MLLALTERLVRAGVRNLDLLFAVVVPILTFAGFTVALRDVIDTGQMSYAQYVLPAVVVQATLFGALNSADTAAAEHSSEFGIRLRTFPIPRHAPLAARLLYCQIRSLMALTAAIATALAFGFRMGGGFVLAVAFVLLSLTATLALSLCADATGTRAKRSDTSSQLLLIPQLFLGLLSTGMAPVGSFPRWVQPVVEYQPVSQITETLRGFTTGQVIASNLVMSLSWCIGLAAIFGWLAFRPQRTTA